MTRLFSIASVLICLGCGGSGTGASGSGPLSADECRKLLTKIAEVSYQDLSSSERAEVQDTPEQFETSVQECVTEQNWDRPGYECVLQANTMAAMRVCVLQNR